MADYTLSTDYVPSTNYGKELKIITRNCDDKSKYAVIAFELYDTVGEVWLGPQVTLKANVSRLCCCKFNGDMEVNTSKNYDSPEVQNVLNTPNATNYATLLNLFSDLKQGT